MRTGGRVAAIVVFAACSGVRAGTPAVTLESLLREWIEFERLVERPEPVFATRLSSSSDPASTTPGTPAWFSNDDRSHFVGVETHGDRTEWILLDADGPGAITHIWVPDPAGTLRIYIDGASVPAVEAPMIDLLSGSVAPFVEPFGDYVPQAYNLFFPFPYANHVKITTDDAVPSNVPWLYYQVHYRAYVPNTVVESFSAAVANRAAATIEQARSILAAPPTLYIPSPLHQQSSGTISVNGAPIVVTPPQPGHEGLVRELRITPGFNTAERLRGTLLRLTFDGQTTVHVPLVDFFGVGPELRTFQGLALEVRPDNALVARWPMAFQQSMQIELSSLLQGSAAATYTITVEPYDWNPRSLLFHASWHKDHAVYPRSPRDWRQLDLLGTGHYVGSILNVTSPFVTWHDWWGEGDEKIWADDEALPSNFGTGTEDYYCSGWAACVPHARALHGQPRCDGTQAFQGRTSAYRFRILDRIPFDSRLEVDLEQIFVTSNPERSVVFDGVSYWYASPGGGNAPALTPGDLAVPPLVQRAEKIVPGLVVEGESMPVIEFDGLAADPASMGAHEFAGRVWSKQLERTWYAWQIGDQIELDLPQSASGAQCVHAYLTRQPNGGVVALDFDGTPAGAFDLHATAYVPTEALRLGTFNLSTSSALTARITGDSAGAACDPWCEVGLDCLSLIPATAAPARPALRVNLDSLDWASAANSVTYDVVRGDLAALRASGGNFSVATTDCLADDLQSNKLIDTFVPARDAGAWYLVRGAHCIEGTWNEPGAGQIGSRDAEISASPAACP